MLIVVDELQVFKKIGGSGKLAESAEEEWVLWLV